MLCGDAIVPLTCSRVDHEIFSLQDEVSAAEGVNVTFYGMFEATLVARRTVLTQLLYRLPGGQTQRQPG